jgi:hypothetical protein
LIVIDSSVLVQVIATDQMGVLRLLRSGYGVQPVIVQAVESEVSYLLNNVARFRGRQEQLRKALGNNTLAIADRGFLATILGSGADAWLRQMESEGERLNLAVDRGEAFSHAASIVLGVPVATNDTSAVYRLLKSGESIWRPIIRFWDLVAFGYQVGFLDDALCDRIRQTLRKLGERIPRCFADRSYIDGLPEFYPRLACAVHPLVGAGQPQERFDERLVLNSLAQAARS